MSTLPIPVATTKIFSEVDKNGFNWSFSRQEFNNSCGPACLMYVKSLVHNLRMGSIPEEQARMQVARYEPKTPLNRPDVRKAVFEKAQKGSDSIEAVKQALTRNLTPKNPDSAYLKRKDVTHGIKGHPSWQYLGTRPEMVVEALKNSPYPVPKARLVEGNYLSHLERTSSNFPAILAVIWRVTKKNVNPPEDARAQAIEKTGGGGGGGHFVACVGQANDRSFIILDPMRGVMYIGYNDVTDKYILYDDGDSIGKVDAESMKNPEPTELDYKLVQYIARGRFSMCGLIVTY